ncbi:MAG TPA: winged helix-turn-helix domain-containing protein [Candidatus Acidoferrum sp.]|nr:winged helix-turn-helix domain-containing protein [Candidatus Acidoferrum sp.]
MEQVSASPKLKFGPFVVDLAAGEIRKNGVRIRLQEKPLRLLAMLAERPGELVTRDELNKRLWPDDTFVDFETGLNTAVSKLRDALSDSGQKQRYIETVPRRGYRFLAELEVEEVRGAEAQAEPASHAVAASVGPAVEDTPSLTELESENDFAANLPAIAARPRFVPARWYIVLFALVGLGLTTWILWIRFHSSYSTLTPRTMLAVLPFENLTGDPRQDYICDGFTEEIITELGQMSPDELGIIARTSSMAYKGQQKSISKIAGELHVKYVLEGSVRQTETGFRVTAQLIRADDQTHLWAQDYDRPVGRLVQIQGEVAQSVAREIRVKLTPQTASSFARAREVDPDAYRSFLQGRYNLSKRSGDGLTKAVASFQDSIAKDPDYAPAYAGLADAYNLLIYYGYPPGREGVALARGAAEKAIALDPRLARGHASLAYVYYMWDWKWQAADEEFKKALQLDPNYSTAHHWYAQFLASRGRSVESLAQIDEAAALDPQSLIVWTARAYLLYFAGEYRESEMECRRVFSRDPAFIVAHAVRGLALEGENDETNAISEFQKAIELSHARPAPYLDYLGHAYATAHRTTEAAAIVSELDQKARTGEAGAAFQAATLLALGRKDQALTALQQGLADGEAAGLIWLRVDPRFDPLRADPRFTQLAAKVGVQ